MSTQKIVWTVLPDSRFLGGRDPKTGRLRVSVVVSPRLTPDADQVLKPFDEFLDWPAAVTNAKFILRTPLGDAGLEPVDKPDSELWRRLFDEQTPVAGFVFKDMSQVNLRSFAVRNVVKFLRTQYATMATQSPDELPTLLPWKDADATLKGMLDTLGTRTVTITLGDRKIEQAAPGFDRLFPQRWTENGTPIDNPRSEVDRLFEAQVFGPKTRFMPKAVGIDGKPSTKAFALRALPPDWSPNGAYASVMAPFRSESEYTFYQANRFYSRVEDELAYARRPSMAVADPRPAAPKFDFHQMLASYADLPQLMRKLGLVLDFMVDEGSPLDQAIGQASPVDTQLALDISWGNTHDNKKDAWPQTAVRLTKERFFQREREPNDHADGLLKLQTANDSGSNEKTLFDVYQVDADGSALKTVNFLLTAQNLVSRSLAFNGGLDQHKVTYSTGDKQGLAALRSGGIGVSRHGRSGLVANNAAAAALKNAAVEGTAAASSKIILYAEDSLRGYRVDVFDVKQERWRSLCRRVTQASVRSDGTPIEHEPDEGYVKGASTSSSTTANDDHYLHESMFRWAGWSLVTQRPGRTIAPESSADSGLQGETVRDVQDVAENGNGVIATFTAQPGSLPRLRFGHLYRLRARLVDLAGNSLDVDDKSIAPLEQATDPVAYRRFEPVDPPALIGRVRLSEGESLERLVIRSDFDADAITYNTTPGTVFATTRAAAEQAGLFEYTAACERHVVPPKTSQLQAEQHGAFDDAIGGSPAAIAKQYAIAAREAGTLFDSLPGTQVELVTPPSLNGVATVTSVPPALPDANFPTGERLAPGQYVIHRETLCPTPYLPDVVSEGVALFGVPNLKPDLVLGEGADVVVLPNQSLMLRVHWDKTPQEWPQRTGLRLVLEQRAAKPPHGLCEPEFTDDGAPQWNAAERTLTLYLSQGQMARLRYSSFVHDAYLSHLGLAGWISSEGARRTLLEWAAAGGHWMVTPHRPLTLVHATQHPVCEPFMIKVGGSRGLGDTHTTLQGLVHMHGPSTGKFEVTATWHEWIDDPQRGPPVRVEGSGELTELQLPENFKNQFDLDEAVKLNRAPTGASGSDPGKPRAPGNRHEFGDTKFRLVRYRLRATTRFREYLPPALYADTANVIQTGPVYNVSSLIEGAADDAGAPVLSGPTGTPNDGMQISSTARPAAPRLVYSVPTFKWLRPDPLQGMAGKRSTRLGNGLRVYLERPWYSSGDGELLGVVLLSGASTTSGAKFTDIPEAMTQFVTQWGIDPLFDSVLPKAAARVTDFPAAVTSGTVKLAENDVSVVVAGHRVQYDGERGLWFCDIELDAGKNYMPFVRLALVRYQPHSLYRAEVSAVVLAEFAQVLPRRDVYLTRTGAVVNVNVYGPGPERGSMTFPHESRFQGIVYTQDTVQLNERGRNRFEIVLQTRDPQVDSDLAWRDEAVLAGGIADPPGGESGTVSPGMLGGTVLSKRLADSVQLSNMAIANASGVKANAAAKESAVKPSVAIKTIPDVAIKTVPNVSVKPTAVTTLQDAEIGVVMIPTAPGKFTQAELQRVIPDLWRELPLWSVNATVPTLPQGRPARLCVREFERYYTDRTVPQSFAGKVQRAKVVEERLVYAEFFALGGTP